VPTTETAIGECVRNAGGWARSLEGEFWALADRVAGLPEHLKARAQPILDDVRQALVNDSHVNPTPLGEVIATASRRLLDVLVPAPGPVPPPPPPPPPRPDPDRVPLPVPATGSESVAPERVADRIAEIRRAHPAAEIEVAIRWKTGNR
jgi:hypothetical protein